MAVADIVASRYAAAYFELAAKAGDVDGWRTGLAEAAERVGSQEAQAVLDNPRVDAAARSRFALSLVEGVAAPARNIVRLLVERGRAAVLPAVLTEYDRLADAASGRVRAEVTTAVPVDGALRDRITRELSERLGSPVQTTVRQDPAILGGLVIRIGDRVIDGSVRSRLEQLRGALA